MVTPELLTYIKTSLEKKTSKETIIKALRNANWSKDDIINAFQEIQEPLSKSEKKEANIPQQKFDVVIENPKTNKTSTKDIITIFFLIIIPPLGLLLMWILPKWKVWVKILITIPYLIGITFLGILIYNIWSQLWEYQDFSTENIIVNDCLIDEDCDSGTCLRVREGYICSEGLIDDPCYLDSDCLSGHCPDNFCTEGTEGDPCFLSFDCEEPLMCGDNETCEE